MVIGEDPRRRETEEPVEAPRSIPITVGALAVGVGLWGGWYLAVYAPAGGGALGDMRTPAALTATSGADDAGTGQGDAPRPQGGEALFTARCAACHQTTGAGIQGVFPPLAGSEWVMGDPRRVVAIVTYGLQGKIAVAGESYDSAMPSVQLTDGELAEVLTYVRGAWGNDAGAVEADLVTDARATLAGRTSNIGGQAELEALFR